MVKVLFVCLGNICRSPTAEGVFRKLVASRDLEDTIHMDSVGTHAYHIGEHPDKRAQAAAWRRGVDLSGLRGRQVTAQDLDTYDYVLAMDKENLSQLRSMGRREHAGKIKLFMEFAENRTETEVPDPYFGGHGGFDRVLDMIEDAAAGLLEDILQRG